MRNYLAASLLCLLLVALPVNAWFSGGHMIVAYIAYKKLNPKTRARIDTLLTLNPLYATWTKGVGKKQRALVAFLQAATWPDCIKSAACSPGYIGDGSNGGNVPPGDPTDAQNIGYSDKLMHKYWHFIDIPDSAGAPGEPPPEPNAQTEILKLAAALSSDASDDIKSYDIVWLEHLVGDVHQPLHATARFTQNHPHGDAGGNLLPLLCVAPCHDELHAYWDGLPGDKLTTAQVTAAAKRLLKTGKPAGADDSDPKSWVNASFELAKSAVYVAPIGDDNDPSVTVSPRPDPAYQAHALKVANAQVTLAGYRLAALLNTNLK